ncbi:MAG TPA: family 78 glycoside hydrolase catalytic domain [Rectinemataceae bacterium]|nr:family 78 glycoside hydrolase catalytic domain [Rectinemataceae bacterium]
MDKPSDLRCEYAKNPLGLGTASPRFSWIPPRGERGSRQSAYRILCSSSLAKLESGIGDVWDSGKRDSDRCHLVAFGVESPSVSPQESQCAPLRECSRYWWSVETWNGGQSSRSDPAFFDTALFESATWKASWISMPAPEFETTTVLLVEGSINSNRHIPSRLYHGIYLRKEFELKARPTLAKAYFCGLGYGELYVNGQKAGDRRLDPGQTDYKEGALYSSYDITDSLRAGGNAFGIVLGNGRYIEAYGFGKPRGLLQVLLEYGDGSRQTLLSDGTWTCSRGPILHNGIYSGEVYDARLEEAGWAEAAFAAEGGVGGGNAAGWQPVEIVDGPRLRSQEMPPIRATGELPPRTMSSPDPGVFVFDFGQNFAGVVRLRARGASGTAISLRFAELLTKEGRLHLGTNRESQSRDGFILRGEGEEDFEPRFTYHGFRYVEVRGYPGTPTLDAVRGIVLGTDVAAAGSFVCSDGLVNAIHSNILWGQRSNLMSAPTDCPQRGERMGWLGDAQLASEEACCNFDMAGFYAKYLEDIRLAQRSDGSLSDVVPPYWPLYPADPAWATAYPVLAWTMYWNYGDERILERHYEGLKRYVDFLDASAEGHILNSLGSYGDWCPPGTIYPKKTPMAFTSTWYLYHDTLLFSRVAETLGRRDDAAAYAARARDIAKAFNEKFLLGDGRYATLAMSPIDRSVGQTTQALPLYLDMVPTGQREGALRNLLGAVVTNADSHIDAGIVGTRYLFEVLRDTGNSDVAWDVITQTSYPGWGYMVSEGATTLWERWEKLAGMGMNSHNHIMFGSVDAWFYRSLGGIIPLEPGWTNVRVAPKTPGSLTHASATRMTPRGKLSAAWSRSPWLRGDGAERHASARASSQAKACDGGSSGGLGGAGSSSGAGSAGGGEFRLALSVPDGTKVHVELPYAELGRELREGGRILWSSDGIYPDDAGSVEAVFDDAVVRRGDILAVGVGSGDYEFLLSW